MVGGSGAGSSYSVQDYGIGGSVGGFASGQGDFGIDVGGFGLDIDFPVGSGWISVLWPRITIPTMGRPDFSFPTSIPNTMPDWRPEPPIKTEVDEVSLLPGSGMAPPNFRVVGMGNPQEFERTVGPVPLPTYQEYMQDLGNPYITEADYLGKSTDEDETMALDLGNLLGDLAGQYINTRWGPSGPVQQNVGLSTYASPTFETGATVLNTEGAIPLVGGPEGGAPGRGYVWKPATATCVGRWIKRGRRRRKRLATASDIRDLSSLKSVLGPQAMKAWIATHPS